MKTEFVYGPHVIESLIRNRPDLVLDILVQESRDDPTLDKVLTAARKQGISIQPTDRRKLDQITDQALHQGVVARIQVKPMADENQLLELVEGLGQAALLLFLDGVQDPHNLGACIRTAEAAGVHGLVFQKDRAATLSPAARKAAAGAAERLPLFQVVNLGRALEKVKKAGIWTVGAAGQAETSLYQQDLTGPLAVVMGAEGAGLRTRTRALCDHLVSIPMPGPAESLNVSVATGVVLFEAVRQRGIKP